MMKLGLRAVLFMLLVSLAIFAITWNAYSCTDFRVTAKDGTVIVAKTMEWDIPVNANIRTANRGQ